MNLKFQYTFKFTLSAKGFIVPRIISEILSSPKCLRKSCLPFLLNSLVLKAAILSTTSSLSMQTHADSTADPKKM